MSEEKMRYSTCGLCAKNVVSRPIDQCRYIKIQPKTIDLSTRLMGITTEFVGFIPKSLVLKSIVLGWILLCRNWSIAFESVNSKVRWRKWKHDECVIIIGMRLLCSTYNEFINIHFSLCRLPFSKFRILNWPQLCRGQKDEVESGAYEQEHATPLYFCQGVFINRFIFKSNLLWMRLPWECHNQSQDTNWRHCVTAPELPFFHKRKGVLKIDPSVKMPWHRLSMGVASSCSSAPGGVHYAVAIPQFTGCLKGWCPLFYFIIIRLRLKIALNVHAFI